MAENQESPDAENASTPASSSTPTSKRSTSKKSETTKRKPGKMTVRLLLDHEHALTLASVQLARAGEEVYTIPQMIEQALDRYMDYLQIKKGVDFLGTVPKKAPPAK
jgi:hypothetical protein